MVRKRIRKMISGGAVVFIVLLCILNVSHAQIVVTPITYTISGSAGVPGVTMTGLPSQNGQTVVTDQNGYYSAVVNPTRRHSSPCQVTGPVLAGRNVSDGGGQLFVGNRYIGGLV